MVITTIFITTGESIEQSWRKNDRIEAFRIRQIIENQVLCPDQDVTFELVTGKSHLVHGLLLR